MRFLIEDYLDDEKKFYDYGTEQYNDIKPENLFTTKRSEMSYYTDLLDPKLLKYYEKNKDTTAEVKYMTPKEYFRESAELLSRRFNKHFNGDYIYNKTIKHESEMEHLRQVINKYKRKLCIPMLDYREEQWGQEGNHRMALAVELFGWEEKFPVLCVYDYKN